jgi:hypothetical protein
VNWIKLRNRDDAEEPIREEPIVADSERKFFVFDSFEKASVNALKKRIKDIVGMPIDN